MALQTEQIDFEAERESLREEMESLAEEQASWNPDTQHYRELIQQGRQYERFHSILEWAEDEWGVDGITLAGRAPGEVNRVEDIVSDNPTIRERDVWVAIGTHDAPYLTHDPDAITNDDLLETVRAVVDDVPLPFVRWAEMTINDLSHMGADMGNGYLSLVAAKRRETSADGNG